MPDDGQYFGNGALRAADGSEPALGQARGLPDRVAFTPGASEFLDRVENLKIKKPFEAAALRNLARTLVLAAKADARV